MPLEKGDAGLGNNKGGTAVVRRGIDSKSRVEEQQRGIGRTRRAVKRGWAQLQESSPRIHLGDGERSRLGSWVRDTSSINRWRAIEKGRVDLSSEHGLLADIRGGSEACRRTLAARRHCVTSYHVPESEQKGFFEEGTVSQGSQSIHTVRDEVPLLGW